MLVARFKKLSPAMKIVASTISFFSSAAGIAALYLALYPITNFNSDVVGRWDSDYSYPVTDGILTFKGRTNVFHEGKYNVAGVITIEGKVEDQGYKFSYNVVGAGTWTADSKRMSITLQNMHSSTKSMMVAGIYFSPELAEKLSGKPVPALSDAYPSGLSDEYNLESVSPGVVVLQATDPFGKPFQIQMHRQS
ncbi:hypothetical protein LT699_10945 [Pseudomonas syringae pv. syringae]|uniref:hypothetical protein n=1 Tax=Pseudomonas syringae TaxID=317 RepID=UPI00200B719C|nr:hypothetical protein [Pseudomonas syringae]MCK9747110.1 hypothetical protein [Pseudomonas syringae pv. syringae]